MERDRQGHGDPGDDLLSPLHGHQAGAEQDGDEHRGLVVLEGAHERLPEQQREREDASAPSRCHGRGAGGPHQQRQQDKDRREQTAIGHEQPSNGVIR